MKQNQQSQNIVSPNLHTSYFLNTKSSSTKCVTDRKLQNKCNCVNNKYLNILEKLLVVKIWKCLANQRFKVQLERLYQSTQLHWLVTATTFFAHTPTFQLHLYNSGKTNEQDYKKCPWRQVTHKWNGKNYANEFMHHHHVVGKLHKWLVWTENWKCSTVPP